MIYEFPDWAREGAHVMYKGMEWVIKNTYVTGNYAGDWGVLELESAFTDDVMDCTPVT